MATEEADGVAYTKNATTGAYEPLEGVPLWKKIAYGVLGMSVFLVACYHILSRYFLPQLPQLY